MLTSTRPRAASPRPSRGPAPTATAPPRDQPSRFNTTSDVAAQRPSPPASARRPSSPPASGSTHRPSRPRAAASRPATPRRRARTAKSTARPSATDPRTAAATAATAPVHTVVADPDRVSRRRVRRRRLTEVGRREPVYDAINCACSSMIFVNTDGSNAVNCRSSEGCRPRHARTRESSSSPCPSPTSRYPPRVLTKSTPTRRDRQVRDRVHLAGDLHAQQRPARRIRRVHDRRRDLRTALTVRRPRRFGNRTTGTSPKLCSSRLSTDHTATTRPATC
jgi:hypothetical protein